MVFRSLGHYVDLISAVLGLIFVPLGYFFQLLARVTRKKMPQKTLFAALEASALSRKKSRYDFHSTGRPPMTKLQSEWQICRAWIWRVAKFALDQGASNPGSARNAF